jgi:hypothetical protein
MTSKASLIHAGCPLRGNPRYTWSSVRLVPWMGSIRHPGGQVEQPVVKAVEGRDAGVGSNDVGVFGVHIAQIDGMRGLRTVKAAVFRQSDAVMFAKGVEY